MKKSDLKRVLKPLIKECIKEVIFEDGVLSGIIAEVTKGMDPAPLDKVQRPPIRETVDPTATRMRRNAFNKEQSTRLKDQKNKLMTAIGKSSYNGMNLFEGTKPLNSPGVPGSSPAPSGPLSNVAPSDAGVDIGGLFSAVGRKWNAHMTGIEED